MYECFHYYLLHFGTESDKSFLVLGKSLRSSESTVFDTKLASFPKVGSFPGNLRTRPAASGYLAISLPAPGRDRRSSAPNRVLAGRCRRTAAVGAQPSEPGAAPTQRLRLRPPGPPSRVCDAGRHDPPGREPPGARPPPRAQRPGPAVTRRLPARAR